MCTCLADSEAKLTDVLTEENGLINVSKAGYATKALVFSNPMQINLYLNFEIEHKPINKDGTPAMKKTFRKSVFLSYCPFCGEEYKKDNSTAETSK